MRDDCGDDSEHNLADASIKTFITGTILLESRMHMLIDTWIQLRVSRDNGDSSVIWLLNAYVKKQIQRSWREDSHLQMKIKEVE